MKTKIDHLVVAAASLDEGVTYVQNILGVDIPYGGEHPLMGTHNHVMPIGQNIFLEVIAQNPEAEKPLHPCWFGFDDPLIQKSLLSQPRLLTWVVNTSDINACLGGAKMSCGRAHKLRRGALEWYFGLPADGRLLVSGMLPYIIQWQTEKHPASLMADSHCVLKKLDIFYPKVQWLQGVFTSIGFTFDNNICLHQGEARLEATLQTPSGRKVLL